MADSSKGKLLSFWNMQASHIVRLTSVREDSMVMDEILQYYGIIFSLTVFSTLYTVDYTLLCASEALEHLGMSFFLKTTVLFNSCKGQPVCGTWLHGNLYIVHYKGFACAEIWHCGVQSSSISVPRIPEMPPFCVSRKICAETYIWPFVFDSQDGSTREIIKGAQESLGTEVQTIGSF